MRYEVISSTTAGFTVRVRLESSFMMEMAVQIVKFVADEPQPGIASSEFVDAEGHRHTITDKVPMCSSENLDVQSSYPQPGAVRCEVLARWRDNSLVRLTVWFTGLSGAGKTTICSPSAEFQDNPRESAQCLIGQTSRPEAAVRSMSALSR
jgi:hypothetical protein